jgi:hypothetical protein
VSRRTLPYLRFCYLHLRLLFYLSANIVFLELDQLRRDFDGHVFEGFFEHVATDELVFESVLVERGKGVNPREGFGR